jgi:hypothetical protein
MNLEKYMLPCINKKWFGIDCFGCGMQRSIFLICKGNFMEAFYQFPAIYTTLLLFASLLLKFIDKKRNYHKIIISLAIINSILMMSSYFYKILNH